MNAEEITTDECVTGFPVATDPSRPQCLVRLLHRPEGSVPRAAPRQKEASTVRLAPAPEDASALLGDADDGPMSYRERQTLDAIRSKLFDAAPSEPQTISRYVMLEPLGSGGFGVVYRAFDPELQREVAIKVLDGRNHRRVAARKDPEWASHQLLVEAQAIARLSHPNIVSVHDFGTFPGLHPHDGPPQVFMVMELVDGKSVSDWLTQRVRGWREVLDVFVQAGRGLAAAHAAGVIHRDFKPGNAVIGRDGTVRVLDFGLAQPDPGSDSSWPARVRSTDTEAPSSRIAGTPAYMSPETFVGDPVDARSDQYSFCVALHFALYGWRPASDIPRDQTARLRADDLDRQPVPRWVAKVIRRGLSYDPADRWPTMDALLAALTRERPVGRFVLPALVGCIAIGSIALTADDRPRCSYAARQLADVWSVERQAEVRDAMLQTHATFAHDSWPRAKTALDAYVDDWAQAHHRACVAADLEQRESAAALDSRMHCLASARREMAALVDVLAKADRSATENAVRSIAALPDPAACDTAVHQKLVDAPADADGVARVRSALAVGWAEHRSGHYADALAIATRAHLDATRTDYAPVIAEALILRATVHDGLGRYGAAEQELSEAYMLAKASGDDRSAMRAASLLVFVVGGHRGDHEEGLAWGRTAMAEVERVDGLSTRSHADVLYVMTNVHVGMGDYAAAEAGLREAIAIDKEVGNDDSVRYARALGDLALVIAQRGRASEAMEVLLQARNLAAQSLGPAHPNLVLLSSNVGGLAVRLNDYDLAEREMRNAMAIAEGSLEADHPLVATLSNNLGVLLNERNMPDEALIHLERAREVWESTNHKELGMVFINFGNSHGLAGRPEAAVRAYSRAAEILERDYGPSHRRTASAMVGLASAVKTLGDLERARDLFRRGIDIFDAVAPDDPDLHLPLCHLTDLELERGAAANRLAARCLDLAVRWGDADEIAFAQRTFDRAVATALR